MSDLKLIIQPDEDDPTGAQIFVDGIIGTRPYRFLLDSGASRTSLIPDEYIAAFPTHDQHSSSGVFAQRSSDVITVPSLEVGSLRRENFSVVREAAGNPRQLNLIGMDLLKDFRLHFRFDESRVSVDEPEADAYGFLPLQMDSRFHPYVDVQLGDTIAKAVWDTGASITLVDAALMQKYPASFQEAGASTGTDSTGAQVEGMMYTMSPVLIGGHRFPSQHVGVVDLSQVNATLEIPMDMILGYPALSQAHWLFDFPNQRWAITQWLAG